MKHWKEYLTDESQPACLRTFLKWTTLPPQCRFLPSDLRKVPEMLRDQVWVDTEPLLFATVIATGKLVRVMHAGHDGRIYYAEDYLKPWAARLRHQRSVASLDEMTGFTTETPGPEGQELRDMHLREFARRVSATSSTTRIVEKAAHDREMKNIRRARRAGVGR